jgi:hypothetical protein
MDISFISEKAGTGILNASKATAATIMDIEYIAFIARSPFIVVTVVPLLPQNLLDLADLFLPFAGYLFPGAFSFQLWIIA